MTEGLEIPLTQGFVAIVDAADYEAVMQRSWHVAKRKTTNYACHFLPMVGPYKPSVLMHQFIMGQKGIDHINHDGLDNQRSNLRVADQSQNGGNRRPQLGGTSQYKGVGWHKGAKKWIVFLHHRGERHYLKLWDDEIEAAKAYDRKARELFGEFAYLNFPEEL